MKLPKLMIAPNGARRTKKDHKALPINIPDILDTIGRCKVLGADGLHLHIRDKQSERHILDVGIYREYLQEIKHAYPTFCVQITTESVGRYSAIEQRDLVRQLQPEFISLSIREIMRGGVNFVQDFYQECRDSNIYIQHILYNDEDYQLLLDLNEAQPIADSLMVLFVLGRYNKLLESRVEDLTPFLKMNEAQRSKKDFIHNLDWAVCAFGKGETSCLVAAHNLGGKIRIGFENSLWHSDGRVAKDNADRIMHLNTFLTP